MSKQGEINYIKLVGEKARAHAFDKPFADPIAGRYLIQIGCVLLLLPPPPAKLIDLGCGTGWTSCFFARAGYDVLGVDISPHMIELANKNKKRYGTKQVNFIVDDFASLKISETFECAVFFDSLHHAEDEYAAIASVYDLLKEGGVCVASEPGVGHSVSEAAINAVNRFNVTEKDMPPKYVIKMAREIGFRKFDVFPHADLIAHNFHIPIGVPIAVRNKAIFKIVNLIRMFLSRKNSGVLLMYK
ncbi:MAG: class I SAM-dependent methyltransferase [Candidatus Hodarchaeota archaeon]